MRDFKKYNIWERSHQFVLKIYGLTKSFPASENFGITSQLRRAAASIPTNIAEGCGRESDKEFAKFLVIASGSASEVNYLLILSKDLSIISEIDFNAFESEIVGIHKSIHTLIKKLRE